MTTTIDQRAPLRNDRLSWFIARSEPRREDVAKRWLRRDGFEVYVPMRKVFVMPRRNQVASSKRNKLHLYIKEEIRPWLPSYVFVRPGRGTIRAVRDLFEIVGVTGVVKFGESPAQVDDSTIEEIRARELNHTLDIYQTREPYIQAPSFKTGEVVRIIDDGVFHGHTGTIERIEPSKEIAHLLTNLFGQQCKTAVSVDQIEKL